LKTALQDEEVLTIESVKALVQKNLSSKRTITDAADFCSALNRVQAIIREENVATAVEFLIGATSYFVDADADGKSNEIFQSTVFLARRHTSLQSFLDALLLQREIDAFEYDVEKISLLTLHAAKGLEFKVVFIMGCEESIAPLSLAGFATDADEERRLFYVGMTRAKERLYLLRASKRMLFGKSHDTLPSPFLADIEEQLKEYEAWQAPVKKGIKAEDKQLTLF
jgi:superfamily I DNA/RNA helicase